MPISYVGGATATSAGNTDVSVPLNALTGGSDSSPSTNDLILFAYNIADADNVDLDLACNTASFAELADLFGNGTNDANLGIYWKFFGSETAVVGEGSLGGTDTAIQGVAMVFRGVNTGVPFNVTIQTATGTTLGNPLPPLIDHNNPSGLWTVIIGANAHTANADGTFTAPTGYTTDFLTVGNQDTADGIIGMGYRTDPTDPEIPGAMTSSHTATGWCAATIALNPANPQEVTPSIATLTMTLFAPTVTASNNQNVTPSIATITITTFAPTISLSDNQNVTPSIATLTVTTFAPTVAVGDPNVNVTPGIASLTITTFAPTVAASDHQTVVPGIATISISTFAPTISITNHQFVTPGTATVTVSTFAPTVEVSGGVASSPLLHLVSLGMAIRIG